MIFRLDFVMVCMGPLVSFCLVGDGLAGADGPILLGSPGAGEGLF